MTAEKVRNLEPAWVEKKKNGSPKASYDNTILALRLIGAKFAHDLFRVRDTIEWPFLGRGHHPISDHTLSQLRDAVRGHFNFDPKAINVIDAVKSACAANQSDPVLNYFNGLMWDGQPRLKTWLHSYLGAENSAINQAFGELILIAAARRVFEPGCKFDNILVLEGPQGAGKSSALRILAPHEDLFTDQDMLHLDAQAQQEALAGKLIVELGELAGMRRTESEKIKAFASRTHDRARAAYARISFNQPRRCIFVGTTNDSEYLTDHTGNRRFWPVSCGEIDLQNLRADVVQLWAEAVVAAQDETQAILLSNDLWQEAAKIQNERIVHDPWIEQIHGVETRAVQDGEGLDWEHMNVSDIMHKIGIMPDKQTSASARRLAVIMRKLGWAGPFRTRSGCRLNQTYKKPMV